MRRCLKKTSGWGRGDAYTIRLENRERGAEPERGVKTRVEYEFHKVG